VSAQICLQLLTISHLAWAPTLRKPNLHKLMTSVENQEYDIRPDWRCPFNVSGTSNAMLI